MSERTFINGLDQNGAPLAIAVQDGRIHALAPQLIPSAQSEVIDLAGQLVLPGFVDGHIHLDKSFVGDHWHPHQPTNSLRERLAVEKQLLAKARPIQERAQSLIAQAAAFGTLAMRCHVDVDASTGLSHLTAVLQARAAWADWMEIELVAFPQAGVISCPGTLAVMDQAMRAGAQVVGGIDPTSFDGNPVGQLDALFKLADKHNGKIDIHLHEPGEMCLADLQRIAERTQALGLQGKVAVSHAYGLGDLDDINLRKIAEVLAVTGIAIMTNAPGDRSFPPIKALREAGVSVFSGNDNIQDAWWPFGNADMLQRAMLVAYRSGFYTDSDLNLALDMATHASAAIIGLRHYGLQVGHPANFVLVNAANAAAAVATVPSSRTLVRNGEFWQVPCP